MGDAIRTNQNVHSWGSIILKMLDGDRYYGFRAIEYGDKRERVLVYGGGRAHGPRGKTSGKYTPDNVKLTYLKASAQALRDALAARAEDGKSYGNVEFIMVVQTIEPGEIPLTVEIHGCTIDVDSTSHAESADPLEENFELSCRKIIRNGKTLYDQTEGDTL